MTTRSPPSKTETVIVDIHDRVVHPPVLNPPQALPGARQQTSSNGQANVPDPAQQIPIVPLTPTARAAPPRDLAALLTSGLAGIQSSMGSMEAELCGKFDALEEKVTQNRDLTSTLQLTSSGLSALERQTSQIEWPTSLRLT